MGHTSFNPVGELIVLRLTVGVLAQIPSEMYLWHWIRVLQLP